MDVRELSEHFYNFQKIFFKLFKRDHPHELPLMSISLKNKSFEELSLGFDLANEFTLAPSLPHQPQHEISCKAPTKTPFLPFGSDFLPFLYRDITFCIRIQVIPSPLSDCCSIFSYHGLVGALVSLPCV